MLNNRALSLPSVMEGENSPAEALSPRDRLLRLSKASGKIFLRVGAYILLVLRRLVRTSVCVCVRARGGFSVPISEKCCIKMYAYNIATERTSGTCFPRL